MGDIRKTPALALRDALGIQVAIETGTGDGASAMWLASKFDCALTIENDAERLYGAKAAAEQCEEPRPLFFLGDSPKVLNELLDAVAGPALLWLDAHWCSGQDWDARPECECPLRDELAAVRPGDLVLIDDAKYYTRGDPSGLHTPEQWPSLDEIKALLPDDYAVSIHNDVIVAVPAWAQEIVEEWAREHS